jgi:hypothetical protein
VSGNKQPTFIHDREFPELIKHLKSPKQLKKSIRPLIFYGASGVDPLKNL